MLILEIPGNPVPWTATSCTRQGIRYSPKSKEKSLAKLQVQSQYCEKPVGGPVFLEMYFFMPIPKSFSHKKREALLKGHYIKKPDTTNLQKFAEDCLTGIVYVDDAQVCQVFSKKVYSENPKTVIYVHKL